ncbi:MAG: tetratricopeptide repeat protein [Pontibacterium sp.]
MKYFLLSLGLLFSVPSHSSLTPAEYAFIVEVTEQLEFEEVDEAKAALNEALQINRSDYSRAVMLNILAQVLLAQGEGDVARAHMEEALAMGVLPLSQQQQMLYSVAQLYCADEAWPQCIAKLSAWMALAPEKVTANSLMLMARAHSGQEDWPKVVMFAEQAIQQAAVVPASWFQLVVFAYTQQEQWPQSVVAQQRLVEAYPNTGEHWRQLVSLQLYSGQEGEALATQRLAYASHRLKTEADINLLLQLLIQNKLPFQAAQVLLDSIEQQTLSNNSGHLERLAQLWSASREREKALTMSRKVHSVVNTEPSAFGLVSAQLAAHQWSAVVDVIAGFEERQQLSPRLTLRKGIALLQLERFAEARQSLESAAQFAQSHLAAQRWLEYLSSLEGVPKS